MSIFTKLGVSVAAPFNADGTPRQISPQDFQIWMTEVERLIKGLLAGAGGVELPELIYKYIITGGDENAIVAQPNATPPTAAGEALFTIEITTPNTGNVTINDKPLLSSSGSQLVAGGLVSGIWLFLDDGENFRLVSDQASQAIMNAVENALMASQDAQDAAELARDIAVSAASDVVSQGNVPIYSTRNAVEGLVIPTGITAFRTNGFAYPGDGGGALYVRAATEPAHAGKVQSADGAWWELSRGQIINIKMFGAVGDGVANDTLAIQSAIDFVCPFVWKGGTRATELGAVSGALFIPVGVFRYTQPLKLSPSLMIYGETIANDWSAQWGDIDPVTGGDRRLGSCLYADISDYNVYAIDTAPYHTDGQRHLGDWLKGGDSYDGLKTEVHGISMRDITFYGKWTCKGLNMAGAVSSMLDNVVIAGFTVGIRYSATWFGSTKDLRILANWKGIISYMSVTDLFMANTTILKTTTAPAYDPDTMGSDPCLPQVGAWWLPLWNKVTSGIVNVYSSMTAKNLTVEHFQCYSQGQNAANDFQNVHIEGISYIAIISHGPDQNNERHVFETIAGNDADLIACQNSRLEVGCLRTNYTQSGFNRLFFDISTSSFIYKPIIWGLTFKAGETFNSDYIARKDFYNSSGGWGPELRAGGASLGTQSNRGRWVRQGNLVTVWGYLTVSSKSAATGSLTITGLPFVSRDDFGFFAGGIISYAYNSPTAGTPIRISHNSSSIEIIGKTHADIQNDADLRFSLTYETTENSLW